MQNGARPRWEGAEPRTARRKGLGGDTVISALDAELFRADWKPQPSLQMESNSSQCEDETPSLLWGLDPVFLAFAKLYIRDILDLKESGQVQGVFFYNGHPIKQVDILGTVIGVREKDAFYSYGVDDSTGVINCICWKRLNNTKSSSATATPSARELSLTSQLKKLQETIAQRAKLEIGDIIRVRGHIRMFRGEREIHATTYYKVDDPVCNVQIARMLELPAIYRKVYDQPFHSPALKEDEALSNPGTLDLDSLTCLLSEKAKEFLVENRVQSFYQQELETVESLLSLANQPVIHSACSGQMGFKNDTTSRAIHSIFRNAVKLLQEEGLVFQKDGGFDNLFYVTREDKELHRKIHRIIQEECQKPNHVEKGCHFLHILACARLSLSPGLSEPVLQQVLQLLEDQSDIVSTTEKYYTAF
ncbi:CST complex subunit STN1 isoform X7 [Bos indicus x Bos taurus]|nr:CST complex subunit STN1 isoform X8 [Bos taurus]XP_027384637.1 CST complex subunit STN1 isoform X7 [Bos indicus x Bos taurus]